MTDDEPIRDLSDLNVATVRRENEQVDEAMSDLEDTLEDLRGDVAEKDQRIETLEEEKETAEQLLATFQEGQREEQLQRIKEANAAVSEDDEVDLEALEDADVDTLETVADMVERAAETASAPETNADRSPDVGGFDPEDVTENGDDVEDKLAAKAEEMGMGKAWEKLQNDDFSGPQSIGYSNENNSPAQALADALEQVGGGN